MREQAAEIAAESFSDGLDARATGQAVRAALELAAQASSQVIGRLDAQRAYNYGVLAAGEATDVALAQVVDGCHVERHGRIDTVSSLMLESIDGPSCTMTVRLLPKAPEGLSAP